MTSPANELQAALYAMLLANTDVAALVGNRVYDRVPREGDVAPFITFGSGTVSYDGAECIEADMHFFQIDIWSEKQGGFKECKEILYAVKKAVVGVDIDLPVHGAMRARTRIERTERDTDGLTSHGILQIEVRVEDNG